MARGAFKRNLRVKSPLYFCSFCYFSQPFGVFLLRLSSPKANLDGGAHLGWAPSRGALVLVVDHTLVPPLSSLKSGGMTASGAIMTTLASSLTKVFSGMGLMACGIPSKL